MREPTRYDAAEYLPHRPPMLFVDYAGFDGNELVAFSTVKADWVALNAAGEVETAALFEIMAQGYALITSAMTAEQGRAASVELGFLVGVKNFAASRPVKAGETLLVKVGKESRVGPFSVFEAFILTPRGEGIASAQLKVVLADRQMLEGSHKEVF